MGKCIRSSVSILGQTRFVAPAEHAIEPAAGRRDFVKVYAELFRARRARHGARAKPESSLAAGLPCPAKGLPPWTANF